MVNIQNIHRKVPMMFRAQTRGRCQLNYLPGNNVQPDVIHWAEQWIERASSKIPEFDQGVQSRSYDINWRFVTNAGQDDGIIRPVIGANGIPFFPGSSMKGAFARACDSKERERYCGRDLGDGDFAPGILRFQGGYPGDDSWSENLIDIVHPQQNWQVQSSDHGGAFPMISLYKPTLNFGISSTIDLDKDEWERVWQIWEKALSKGIGCRVSAGYGQPRRTSQPILYATELKGEGIAPKLLDGSAEFRPNIFRAGIRGHALRIFGGLTDANSAQRAVEQLFGGTENDGGTFGLLCMRFRERELDLDSFGNGNWAVPTYEVKGRLSWMLTKPLGQDHANKLLALIKFLNRFAMVLGGFGRSWRRSDHRLFYPGYYNQNQQKPLIGCHWQWQEETSLKNDISVLETSHLGIFIDRGLNVAKEWLQLQGYPTNQYANNWREAWHRDKVQVWGRLADDREDSRAISWLHGPYRNNETIYHTNVTGSMGQVGRLWHRMYCKRHPKEYRYTRQYLEFLTIFPDQSNQSDNFLDYLQHPDSGFKKLWPTQRG